MSIEQNTVVQELARRLEKSKFVGHEKSRVLNFRCPICGDSERSKNKKRGYIYEKDGKIWFSCFNCSTNLSLRNFLKETNPDILQMWELGNLKEKQKNNPSTKREDVFFSIEGLIPIKTLPENHIALKYIKERQIPVQKYQFIFYSDQLNKKLQCSFNKGIVFTDNKALFVARNIDKTSKTRYFIKKGSDEVFFGEKYLNISQNVKIVEGLIDSLFLQNSIPTLNSNLQTLTKKYPNSILIWDNEPRNPEICAKMERALKCGESVVIWPDCVKEYKDINEMAIAGYEPEEIVSKNNFKGILGLLKFNFWKR